MTALFIADLHLSPERPAVTRAFLDFLQGKARKAHSLYILGDLFEAWVGDDDPSPLPRQIVAALAAAVTGFSLYVKRSWMGFSFDAVADDATAAFANPAGLVQLVEPEVSLEGRHWSYSTAYTQGGRIDGQPTGASFRGLTSTARGFRPVRLSTIRGYRSRRSRCPLPAGSC